MKKKKKFPNKLSVLKWNSELIKRTIFLFEVSPYVVFLCIILFLPVDL
jgi:hypothetical protein